MLKIDLARTDNDSTPAADTANEVGDCVYSPDDLLDQIGETVDYLGSSQRGKPPIVHESDEWRADQEAQTNAQDALWQAEEQCYSTKPEQFWLGAGATYNSVGRIRDNIRNAWLAQSLGVGQFLATLVPRNMVVVPPDIETMEHTTRLWLMILAEVSGGKSPVAQSIDAFHRAIKWLDKGRDSTTKSMNLKIAEIAKTNESFPASINYNPSIAQTTPGILSGNTSLPALCASMGASDMFSAIDQPGIPQLQSAGNLIYSREGVSFLKNLGAFNQDASGTMSTFSGLWASEVDVIERRTDSSRIAFDEACLAMMVLMQTKAWLTVVKNESAPADDETDVGFALRAVTIRLANTATGNRTYTPRGATTGKSRRLPSITTSIADFQAALFDCPTEVACTPEAAEMHRDVWFTWLKARPIHGWLNGLHDKAMCNVVRIAFNYRMIELYDDFAAFGPQSVERGFWVLPDMSITASAMERAIEASKISVLTAEYHYQLVQDAAALKAALRDSEKTKMLLASQTALKFTDPLLLADWVAQRKADGATTRAGALRSMNASKIALLKESGIDVRAIVSKFWPS